MVILNLVLTDSRQGNFLQRQFESKSMKYPIVFLALANFVHGEVWTPPKMTPDNICKANPISPDAAKLAAPLVNCANQVKDGLVKGHPDQNRNTSEVLKAYGYGCKTYQVTTKDGYILTLYQITSSPKNKGKGSAKKPPVLIQHGLISASDNWFFQPLSRNLPMMLADAGYDVWLGNARGTTYSQKHVKYNADTNLKYWDFSWHEMGIYDIPAVIDQILKTSKADKIFYVGHSMGTTMMFVALSEIPALNNKLIACFMLAPIMFLGHMNSPVRLALPLVNTDLKYKAVNLLLTGKLQTMDHWNKGFNGVLSAACSVIALKCGVCDNIVFLLFGYDAPQTNYTEIPNIYAKVPNTASVKTFAHYAQCASTCTFRKYDFGLGNLKKYKSTKAPAYNVSNINASMYFYYGQDDNLGQPNDVFITARAIKNAVRRVTRVNHTLFTHVDFQLAQDADNLLYKDIRDTMNKLKPK